MNEKKDTVWSRIWKYRLHYVIVLPAMALLVIFKLIPFLTGVMSAFKDVAVFLGVAASPWVGWDNFAALFDRPEFRNVLANSLILSLGTTLASSLAAFVLALALAAVRWRPVRSLLSTLFLMPYFIPAAVFAYTISVLLSPFSSPIRLTEQFVLGDPSLFRLAVIGAETLRIAGIPVLIALAAIAAAHEAAERDKTGSNASWFRLTAAPALRAVAAFALIRLALPLAGEYDFLAMLVNPLVHETGDTLTTYIFRTGMFMMEIGAASAAWLFQYAVQLVCACLAYLILRGPLRKGLFSQFERPRIRPSGVTGTAAGLIAAAPFAAAAAVVLYALFILPLAVPSGSGQSAWSVALSPAVFAQAIAIWGMLIVHMLMTVTLAYPLTVRRLPGRSLYRFVLIAVALTGAGTLHEYLLFRSLGLVNTVYAAAFAGFIAVVPAFVLAGSFKAKYGHLKEELEASGKGEGHAFFSLFIPKIWKTWLALGIFQLAAMIGALQIPLTYIADPALFPPVLSFYQLATSGGGGALEPGDTLPLAVGAIASLPGVILFLIVRPWLNAEALISLIRRG